MGGGGGGEARGYFYRRRASIKTSIYIAATLISSKEHRS